jgi:cysteine-rich repeat protein
MSISRIALVALLGVSSAAGFYGCSSGDHSGTPQGVEGVDDNPSDASLNLTLMVVDKTGAALEANTFETTADVYLDIKMTDVEGTVLAQDFVFQVVDAQGNLLSSDALACRKFHVNASGYVDRVYSGVDDGGAACIHMFQRMGDGHLLINLAPFKDALVDENGAMKFTLKVAPLATCGGDNDFEHAISVSFTVQPQAECGDDNLDEGEECDDGNTTNGDGCDFECNNEDGHVCGCGDGITQEGEQCDDGNTTSGDGCSSECTSEPVCGDGHQDAGEECDDGNDDDGDACHNDCTLCDMPAPVCGDGITDMGEQCDDGNTDDNDACGNDCIANVCGDGHQDTGEECDDGNTNNDDTCRNDCTLCPPAPVCGDGTVGEGEGCDDGNTDDNDACGNDCVANVCGDGHQDTGEGCDDGNTDENDGCHNDCTVCGGQDDGHHDGGGH